MNWNAQWVRDASVTVADLVITAALVMGAMLLHTRWLAAVGGLWALLTLRQGYLAARERKRPTRAPSRTRRRTRS
ncbi:hypothetical protein ABZX30_17975 [Streptomyces sp. NPDC004542]|uniref:hypothetical protein n=1 Tax=Streptomyces sp. NPDC004542 TaxID=3154281 RepID=UPI0033A7DAE8